MSGCEEQCKQMFEQIDVNKDGFVQFEEIHAFMEKMGEVCCADAEDMFNEADTNKDGKLNFEEFTKLMAAKEAKQGQQTTCCKCPCEEKK
uniref:EF-hand domain-containing protein n=1 Tax=Trepomonas sp. PC1 TaxID=1076344 RepID=A0A146KBE7_9EUKA|eukprot:JAP92801.1 EF-hand domain-containing protein [Trepomonas sp. PC1]